MSSMHEIGEDDRIPRENELTPEQGELLIEELKRFEPYLEVNSNWPAALRSPPRSAAYDAQGVEVHLMRVEGLEGDYSWWMSWYENPELEVLEIDDIKIEHKHRIVAVTLGDEVQSSYEYERSYKGVTLRLASSKKSTMQPENK